jgi:hypothetical protein
VIILGHILALVGRTEACHVGTESSWIGSLAPEQMWLVGCLFRATYTTRDIRGVTE